jgi:hypothetical protein
MDAPLLALALRPAPLDTPGIDWIHIAHVIAIILLPLVGVALLLFASLAVMLPFGARLQGKTQQIKGFGLELEVSAVVLFFLVGLLLSLIGVYLFTKDYENRLATFAGIEAKLERAEQDFREAREAFREGLVKAQQVDVNVLISLADIDPETAPKETDLTCTVQTFDDRPPTPVPLRRGPQKGQYKARFEDVKSDALLPVMECTHGKWNRTWVLQNFRPRIPEYRLEKRP